MLDNPFGLYRDGTELRGIYCSKPQNARDACRLTGPHSCDFPTLIGNDAYYGGLGGEFTISTKSKTSGSVVLRHEMGHNFVDGVYRDFVRKGDPQLNHFRNFSR